MSIGAFLERRSALSVMDAVINSTTGSALGLIDSLLQEPFSQTSEPHSKPPLLHVAARMSPTAFISLQLLQTPPEMSKTHPDSSSPPPLSHATSLQGVRPHTSLVSCYVSGIICDALVQTATEIQQCTSRGVMCQDPPDSSVDSGVVVQNRSKTLLNTVNVSVDVKCPVLQASLCAMVQETAKDSSHLTGLTHTQSQLNFLLLTEVDSKEQSAEEMMPNSRVCNLMELGICDASIVCVTKVFHSEISSQSILTWEEVAKYELASPMSSPRSDEGETKNNKIAVWASLPALWCQLAAPRTGVPNEDTGGLDVLILTEAMDAWKPWVEGAMDAVELVKEVKVEREKRVLVALLSNAIRCPPFCRVSR